MNNPGISIVIVSYNVSRYLDKCISSILSQKNAEFEIIVVDNNSSDGTVDFLTKKYPSVKIFANKENHGFSTGNNSGIRAATQDLILLLNPDTELPEYDTLEKMKKYMVTNPDTGILAPCLLNTDGTFQPSFWNFPKVADILQELFYLHRVQKKEAPIVPITISAAAGAALCMNKALANRLGGLDPDIFWMEDTDFCYRASKAEEKIIYHPGIKIIHHGGKSSDNNYQISIPNQVISKIKYFRKNGSWLQYTASNLLSLFFILSRFVVFTILSLYSNKIYGLKRKAYSKALRAYVRYNTGLNRGIIR